MKKVELTQNRKEELECLANTFIESHSYYIRDEVTKMVDEICYELIEEGKLKGDDWTFEIDRLRVEKDYFANILDQAFLGERLKNYLFPKD
jgi:hypothetical protein